MSMNIDIAIRLDQPSFDGMKQLLTQACQKLISDFEGKGDMMDISITGDNVGPVPKIVCHVFTKESKIPIQEMEDMLITIVRESGLSRSFSSIHYLLVCSYLSGQYTASGCIDKE